jgi:hypothetical protein
VPEWLTSGSGGQTTTALTVAIRLLAAGALGGAVALVYRATRRPADTTASFTITLVLLAILIAMVTQVVGDNVARAFSLVGALSIVRFRTVVRDTQDTAYVIFAVVIGMAMGAGNLFVGAIGFGITALAAFVMSSRAEAPPPVPEDLPFELTVRLTLGGDPEAVLGPTLDRLQVSRQLTMVSTARQGLAMDVAYRAGFANEQVASGLVQALNRVEGVQAVTLQRAARADG